MGTSKAQRERHRANRRLKRQIQADTAKLDYKKIASSGLITDLSYRVPGCAYGNTR